jgi:hypothetical protein
MGAELVLKRGLDIALLEQATRTRIAEFTTPTSNRQESEAGLACARFLLDQALTQVRAQAELQKALAMNVPSAAQVPESPDAISKLLS